MTGIGIYEYDENGYWPAVENYLDCGSLRGHQKDLSDIYFRNLDFFRLPKFVQERATLKGKTHYYVRLFLLHAGIPKSSLLVYFENVVKKVFEIRAEIDLSVDEILGEVKDTTAWKNLTNQPTKCFLNYGGEVAFDFLLRSLDLYERFIETDEVMMPEECQLPVYVVEAFKGWTQEQEVKGKKSKQKDKPPSIHLDPWGVGVYLDFPPRNLSVLDHYQEATLQVENGSHDSVTKLEKNLAENHSESEEILHRITEPFDDLRIILVTGDSKATWNFRPTGKQVLCIFSKQWKINANTKWRRTMARLSSRFIIGSY